MPITAQHVLSATTPDDPLYEIRPSHWNSSHAITFVPDASELIKWASAGANSISSGTLQFSNLNGVSFGMDVNGVVTGSIAAGVPSPVNFSAGTRSADLGSIVFSNANGVSFGLGGVGSSVMTGSHNGLTTARASNDAIGLNSALTANGVSVTANSSGLSLNFPAFLTTAQPVGAYLTTARASNDAIGLNSALTANGVSVTANSSGLSLNFPAFLTTAALSGDTTKYAGLGTTFNGANISGSMTLNTAGLQMSMSVAAGGGGADGGNTLAAGTRTAGSNSVVLFSNLNGITFGLDAVAGSIMTASHNGLTTARASNDAIGLNSALTANGVSMTANSSGLSLNFPAFLTTAQPVGAYLTTARASNDAIGLNSALTANGVSVTANSSGLSLNFPAFLTTAALSGDTTKYAGLGFTSTTTAGTDVKGTHSTNGLSMAFPLWLTTAALSQNTSNYAGISTGSQSTAGSDIKMTLNTAGLNLGVPAWLTAAGGGGGTAVTMYATSNTTQSSTGTQALSSLMFAGAGIASVGITNGSILISVPSGGGAGDGVNIVSMLTSTSGGGTAGATFSNSNASIGLMAGSNITLSQTSNTIVFNAPNASSLVAGANITISTAGSTISIIGPSAGAGVLYMTYQNRQLGASGSTQFTNNQIWMVPFRVAGGTVSASTLQYIQSLSGTFTSAVAATHAETMKWAVYSQHSTNSSRFDSASSGSLTWQVWNSGTSSGSYAINGSTSSSAGTGILTQAAGIRMMNIPINLSITNGLYVMALAQSSSSAGYSGLFSRYGVVIDSPMPLAMGQNFGAVTATSIGYVDAGSYGTTSAAYPSSVNITDIKQHSNIVPYFKMGAF